MRYPDTNRIIKELEEVNFTHDQGEKLIKTMHQINDAHYHGLATTYQLDQLRSDLIIHTNNMEKDLTDKINSAFNRQTLIIIISIIGLILAIKQWGL